MESLLYHSNIFPSYFANGTIDFIDCNYLLALTVKITTLYFICQPFLDIIWQHIRKTMLMCIVD